MFGSEITIDFMDFIRRCTKKWKFLLVCMLIGGLALDGVSCLRSIKNAHAVEEQLKEQNEADDREKKLEAAGEAMSGLSDREITEVQTAVMSYKEYRQEYEDGLTYYKNSVKMGLDAGCVPTMSLQYRIDNHYEVTYPVIMKKDTTKDIVNTLAEKAVNEDVCTQAADILGIQDNAAYVRELITASYVEDSLLNILILAPDRDKCTQLAQIVEKQMNDSVSSVKQSYGEFTMTLVSEQYYENSDTDVLTAQQQMMTALNSLKSSMSNLLTGMTEAQKTYYYALLETEDYRTSDQLKQTEDGDIPGKQELTVPDVTYINTKYCVLGILFGAFCGIAWLLLSYLSTDRLRISGDIENLYNMSVLGHITDQTKRGAHAAAYAAFSEEEQLQMIVSGIRITAEKEHMQSVYVTGTATTERTMDICRKIEEAVQKKGISCAWGKTVVYDPESAEQMAKTDGVVVVEQIDASRYGEIAKEKEYSEKYHVPVIGCVIIE